MRLYFSQIPAREASSSRVKTVPTGIMGVAQEEQARGGGDQGCQPVKVQGPSAGLPDKRQGGEMAVAQARRG